MPKDKNLGKKALMTVKQHHQKIKYYTVTVIDNGAHGDR